MYQKYNRKTSEDIDFVSTTKYLKKIKWDMIYF